MSKLFWLAITAAAGTCFVVFRKITAIANASSMSGLLKSLHKDPIKAEEVSASLDVPYGKCENLSKDNFENLREALTRVSKIDDYTILYQRSIADDEHLLITELVFSDFDIGVTGDADDVEKKAYHSFALRFDANYNILTIWSDLHDGTTAKFQKEAFSKGIAKNAEKV